MSRIIVLAVAWIAVAVSPGFAQGTNQADMKVDAAMRRQVIDGVLARLIEAYVFPDTAVAMERAIRERVRRHEYERITSAQALADSLTAHLQLVSKDRHLRVRYSYEPLPPVPEHRGPTPEAAARARAFGRQVNFGFEKVERLPGNVGYLELRSFGFEPEWIGAAAAAAFEFLANTDALIIDVRRNGGGSPGMVAFVSSYLFGADSVHLNSLYWRPGNRTDHFYTRPWVPGARYGPDRPVYVLTSRRTFSGAEEFAYNLQTRQRAVIVGDTTGGRKASSRAVRRRGVAPAQHGRLARRLPARRVALQVERCLSCDAGRRAVATAWFDPVAPLRGCARHRGVRRVRITLRAPGRR